MDGAEVVIPAEATVSAPYAISRRPHPDAGKLWSNFITSNVGQTLFALGVVRPAVAGITLAPELAAKLPVAGNVQLLDAARAAQVKSDIDRLWAQAVISR
jgi:putative spermidine/putrescine transport system substrate-binding protein